MRKQHFSAASSPRHAYFSLDPGVEVSQEPLLCAGFTAATIALSNMDFPHKYANIIHEGSRAGEVLKSLKFSYTNSSL